MKKMYLMSIIVLGIAVAAVGLGTYAQYTFSYQSGSNVVTAAPFGVHAELENAAGNQIPDFQVDNLAPGGNWQTAGYLAVWNTGPTDATYTFTVNNVHRTYPTPGTLCAQPDQSYCSDLDTALDLRIIQNPDVVYPGYTWTWWSNNGFHYVTPLDTVDFYSPFNSFTSITSTSPVLNPNGVDIYQIDVKMESSAGNTYQGTGLNFGIALTATEAP